MTKTLQKYGNSHALVIDKALMDAMGITPETPLTLTVHGTSLTITPSNDGVGRDAMAKAKGLITASYDDAMKRLAK
ncbi:MAG: hypothetical protein K2X32_09300 [Phycisphaerales bacterium]|nr:hypothetical protein [Phycisphaerales bacterium]